MTTQVNVTGVYLYICSGHTSARYVVDGSSRNRQQHTWRWNRQQHTWRSCGLNIMISDNTRMVFRESITNRYLCNLSISSATTWYYCNRVSAWLPDAGVNWAYVQFSSRWYLCAQKCPYVLKSLSLRNFPNVRLIDDGPLSSFQERLSSASFFQASLSSKRSMVWCPWLCTRR